MNIGEQWWNRLVNSVRFLDDVKDILMDRRSVIMSFGDDIPWLDIMVYTLEQQLSFMTDTRSFEAHDASKIKDEPGKYLFEHFCSEAERNKYWPGRDKSYERFLATNNITTLNHRIICVTGLNSGNAAAWLKSVTEYLENRDSEERGVFILITQGVNANESQLIGKAEYSDYVSDYDCLMLCLTLLASAKCSSLQKQYISEIASNIADNNVEIAGLLAAGGQALAADPFGTASEILRDNDISIPSLGERVENAVWESQIKLVFPRLEDFRRALVQKYYGKIQQHLPITSSSGEVVDKASEVEIGQLYFICGKHKILDKPEYDRLKIMREARNRLAHRDVLTYDSLLELSVL
ncbi:MAG: hypothetical protein ACI4KM_09990 [Oscillospiraceae bacterium]